MLVLGIDPGLTGALCAMLEDDKTWETTIEVFDVPVIEVIVGKKRRHDYVLTEMAAMLRQYKDAKMAILESVHPMPKNGSIGNFSLGRSSGVWEALLTALEIPYMKVQPQAWKKAFVAGTGRDKGASRLAAMRLFPQIAPRLGRVKDDGRAEAVLLAAYYLQKGDKGAITASPNSDPQMALPVGNNF